jgi:DNA-binding NtrC family response regulator
VDIRIIAATNQDLEEQVRAGAFRSDLYFRLNVVRMRLPSLRERIEDVPLLTRHFLDRLNERLGRAVEGFDAEAEGALLRHAWPGNIRELRNVIEGVVVTLRGTRITFADLPEQIVAQLAGAVEDEKRQLLAALVDAQWNKSRAARQLNWSRMTLYRKMSHYRIVDPAAAPRRRSGVAPRVSSEPSPRKRQRNR